MFRPLQLRINIYIGYIYIYVKEVFYGHTHMCAVPFLQTLTVSLYRWEEYRTSLHVVQPHSSATYTPVELQENSAEHGKSLVAC